MIRVVKIINKIERLRKAIRREGTPAVQEAWDALEPHVSIFLNAERQDGRTGGNEPDRHRSSDLG